VRTLCSFLETRSVLGVSLLVTISPNLAPCRRRNKCKKTINALQSPASHQPRIPVCTVLLMYVSCRGPADYLCALRLKREPPAGWGFSKRAERCTRILLLAPLRTLPKQCPIEKAFRVSLSRIPPRHADAHSQICRATLIPHLRICRRLVLPYLECYAYKHQPICPEF
jgi:hypothetical protein